MQFDSLYHELLLSTEMIRALIAGIDSEAARKRPAPGSWSILEVMCHLYDEEREDFREHLDFILNRQGEEWHLIDPEAWVEARKYNQQDFQEMQDRFFAERQGSLRWLEGLRGRDWATSYTTPFRTMTAGDMLCSWIAHDNLHIRQLVELRRKWIEAISEPQNIEYAGDW